MQHSMYTTLQYQCEQGADKEARDEDGRTPLYTPAREGHLPVVQYMCEQRGEAYMQPKRRKKRE